jgi:hypothetical protein
VKADTTYTTQKHVSSTTDVSKQNAFGWRGGMDGEGGWEEENFVTFENANSSVLSDYSENKNIRSKFVPLASLDVNTATGNGFLHKKAIGLARTKDSL